MFQYLLIVFKEGFGDPGRPDIKVVFAHQIFFPFKARFLQFGFVGNLLAGFRILHKYGVGNAVYDGAQQCSLLVKRLLGLLFS